METYAEYGRMIGLLLKAALTGRVGPFPRMSLVLLGFLIIWFMPSFLGRLDVVIDRSMLWVEVTYATLGAFCAVLLWVGIRAVYRYLKGLLN